MSEKLRTREKTERERREEEMKELVITADVVDIQRLMMIFC